MQVIWMGLLLGATAFLGNRTLLAQSSTPAAAAAAEPAPGVQPSVAAEPAAPAAAVAAEPTQRASTPALPSAPPPKPSSLWRDEWPQFRASEMITTIVAGLGVGTIVLIGPSKNPRWTGGILFDDAVRNALRARSPHAVHTYRRIGDYSYHLSPLLPLVDALVVSTIGHSDSKLAGNLIGVTLEAYSYSGLAAFIATESSARQRPDGSDTQSFFSGHAAISATGAGLTCADHSRIPLWGNPVADVAACVLASLNALTTATTRVVADRHYASDVILGAGVGFGFGYSVPVLLHYAYPGNHGRLAFAPDPNCGPGCIGVRGSF